MPNQIEIVIEGGLLRGQQFRFEAHDIVLFGRAADCHIRLPEQDATASRHHFLLEVNPPQARLRDLGSLGGTYVNGKKYGGRAPGETPEEAARRQYPQVDLADGDEIRAGQHVLRVAVHREMARAESGAPPAQDECGAQPHATERPASTRPPGAASPATIMPPRADAGDRSPLTHLFQQLVRGGRRSASHEEAHEEGGQGSRALGDYEIGQEIGRGSMGAVYLARHRHTGERVALKVMVAQAAVDEQARRRFLREVEATKALRHPNIVALRDSGAAHDTFYFTMEFCDGGSVAAFMTKRGGRLPVAEALPLMEQALDGMAAAHAAGFVHRDLKPENLLLAHRGGQGGAPVAKVADFGLAKSFGDSGLSGLTVTGMRGGTINYMPREQLVHFRDVKPVSDVWALGATFYVLLTGRAPRQPPAGQHLDPLRLVLQGEVVPIRRVAPGIPERLAAVIDRALQPEPGTRYQSAGEMRQALATARP